MTAASEAPSIETVRWYTSARRFPQLIGRTADGARIPGGPYTVTQAIGGGLVLVVASKTTSLWMRFGFFPSIALLAVVFCATVFGLGLIPYGARNPLSIASGAVHALGAPTWGRAGGRKVQPPRPMRVRHRIVIAPANAAEQTQPENSQPPSSETDLGARPADAVTPAAKPVAGDTSLDLLLQPAPVPTSARTATPVLAAPARAPLTGVQALLAAAPPTVHASEPSQEESVR